MSFRAAAVGVVLVLAAAAAPDEWRVLAEQGGADLRFAVPVRDGGAPGSPVLARVGPLSATRETGPNRYVIPAGFTSFTVYTGVTGILVQLVDANGRYALFPDPAPGAAVRQRMENELVVLVTRLNSAGDGLFAQDQDTFVLEPINWNAVQWITGTDASRASRIAAALGSASNRSQWYLVAVDRTVPGVHIDETAQRFVYAPPVPSPPSEARTATPRAGGEPEDVPVPALPLAAAGVLAGLLASAAYRFRRPRDAATG